MKIIIINVDIPEMMADMLAVVFAKRGACESKESKWSE